MTSLPTNSLKKNHFSSHLKTVGFLRIVPNFRIFPGDFSSFTSLVALEKDIGILGFQQKGWAAYLSSRHRARPGGAPIQTNVERWICNPLRSKNEVFFFFFLQGSLSNISELFHQRESFGVRFPC